MELISALFFAGFYIFSILSICWWIYLAHAHDGVGAYHSLSQQKSAFFLTPSIASALKKHFELISILVCFIMFLYALCKGFSTYFSWIPEQYSLTLGDGSMIHLSIVLSCFVGICSSVVFGKWVFIGICSYWEKRALAEQSSIYFEIIRQADNIGELRGLREKTLKTIRHLEEKNALTPGVVCSRLELCIRVIDLRIEDIKKS